MCRMCVVSTLLSPLVAAKQKCWGLVTGILKSFKSRTPCAYGFLFGVSICLAAREEEVESTLAKFRELYSAYLQHEAVG